MLNFETNEEQKRDLEAGAFLILCAVLAFLIFFGIVVASITRWLS